MITVEARPGAALRLGYTGENLARRVRIPVGGWLQLYGRDGVFVLTVVRDGEVTPYPAVLEQEGDNLFWEIRGEDVAIDGTGECQLQYIVDGVVAKEEKWVTTVEPSMDAPGEYPEPPEKGWLQQVAQDGASARTAARLAGEHAETAARMAAAAEKSAEAVLDMEVQAESLPEGYEATVMKTAENGVVRLKFGIPAGQKGDRGEKGERGAKGEPGATGAKGDKGDTGPQGQKGDTGPQGPKGETGATGATGPTGPKGDSGRDGYTPVKGKDYYTEAEKAELVEEVLEQMPEQPSGGISVDKAEIGQTIVVKAVDENGKPTEWEAADFPTGGGEGVQSDWNQNDESQPDYVKNRPFYEVPRIYDITWDGDMTGRTALDLSLIGVSGAYLVKVSDKVYTKEELRTKRFIDSGGDKSSMTSHDFPDVAPGAFREDGFSFGVVYSADEFNAAIGAPDGYYTNGTYFFCAPSEGLYVSALYTEGHLEKLEDKYLPDTTLRMHSVGFGVFLTCELDAGFSYFYINIPAGEIDNLRECLVGNVVSASISIKDGSTQYYVNGCFLMNGDTNKCVGSCYAILVDQYDTPQLAQIFLDVRPSSRSVRVAAKTVDTKPSLTAADMDTIAQNVIAKLPIYNGEVESV